MANLRTAVELFLESRGFTGGLKRSGRAVHGFGQKARQEFSSLGRTLTGIRGQLAGLGLSIGGAVVLTQSAKLDKSLTQIGLTANVGADKVAQLRAELFTLAKKTGQPVEELQSGFNTLVASGLEFDKALVSISAINKGTAVGGANSQALARGLTVAANAFDFDLSQPGKALEILEQMTVAGRLGNAELEDLSGIFGTVGVNAARAGMNFQQSLAFIEALSKSLPGQPEKLATRAESTLRLFTNANYLRAAEATTGVKFFDAAGSRRDTFSVLADIKKEMDTLTTTEQRFDFLSRAFGQADKDTIIGLSEILSGDNLQNMQASMKPIKNAGGTFARDIDRATANAATQAARIGTTLRKAADDFAGPLKDAFVSGTKFLLDQDKANLSGAQLLGVGAAVGLSGVLATRVGGRGLKKLLGGTAGGIAAGQALEEAGLAQSVFVVNWPASLGAAGAVTDAATAASNKGLSKKALLAGGKVLGAVGVAGTAGFAAGTYIVNPVINAAGLGDDIGQAIAKTLAFFGNDEAQAAVDATEKAGIDVSADNNPIATTLMSLLTGNVGLALAERMKSESKIKIEIDNKGQAKVTEMTTTDPGTELTAAFRFGPVMATP